MTFKKPNYIQRKKTKTQDLDLPETENMESFNMLVVICFLGALIYIFNVIHQLDISLFNLFQFYCFFIGLAFLVPIQLYRKELTMSFYEYILFNILSVAPLLIVFVFVLNEGFKSETYIETYKIETYEQNSLGTIYFLEDEVYSEKEYLRSIQQEDNVEVMGNENLSIYFSDGLLGIRIIEKKVLH